MHPCPSAPRCGRRAKTRADRRAALTRLARRQPGRLQAVPQQPSLALSLDRLLQRLVVRAGLERLVPHAPRLVALAELPEHFAQMRADLGVGTAAVRAAQLARRALEVAFAVEHPAQAVDDEVVLGRDLQRLLDQLARFGE